MNNAERIAARVARRVLAGEKTAEVYRGQVTLRIEGEGDKKRSQWNPEDRFADAVTQLAQDIEYELERSYRMGYKVKASVVRLTSSSRDDSPTELDPHGEFEDYVLEGVAEVVITRAEIPERDLAEIVDDIVNRTNRR